MRPEIIECVRQIFELWPAHVTIERIEGYASIIEEGDFDVGDVQKACRALAAIWDRTVPPPVSKIIDRAVEARRERIAHARSGPRRLTPGPQPEETMRYVRASAELRRRSGRVVSPEEVDAYLALGTVPR